MRLPEETRDRLGCLARDVCAGRIGAYVAAADVESILSPEMLAVYGESMPMTEPREYSSPEQGLVVNLRRAETGLMAGAAESLYLYARALARRRRA